ncbi:MAG: 3'-5' exonuclease, partial [Flavobacteriales bacterium]|nr:3'-5' exonuclease [Flavobacteriales bacterium]
MRNERVKDLGHVLFLDIETVPEVYCWSDVDPARQVLWDQKSRFRQASHGKSAEEVYKEAGIFAEFGKIICIGVGRIDKKGNAHRLRVTTLHGDDERDVLLRFVELLDRHYHGEEHRLCAHNGKEFDFP